MGAKFNVEAAVKMDVSGVQQGREAYRGLGQETRKLSDEQKKAAGSSREVGDSLKKSAAAGEAALKAHQQQVRVLAELVKSAQHGSKAFLEMAKAQQVADAVARSGASRTSPVGQSIAATARAQQQLRERLEETLRVQQQADRVSGNISALQARTRALESETAAARQGEAAYKAYLQAKEVAEAVTASGAQPGGNDAAMVEREVEAQQQLRAELEAIARARERDRQAAERAAAQATRIQDQIAALRETTSQLETLAAAHRRGGSAVQQANVQLEVRNALLRAGAQAGSADAAAIEQEVRAQARLRAEIEKITQSTRQQEKSTVSLRGAFFALQGSIAVIGLKRLADDSVGLVTEMEKVERTFRAVLGSADAARNEMAFVRGEADRLGLVFRTTSVAYSQFLASASGSLSLDQIRDVFDGVSEAMANLGISSQQQERALLALSQMASKGVVSMEELRQQLGDALPRAMQIAAQSMDMPTGKFMKLVEEGKVLSKDLLPKMPALWREAFGVGGGIIDNTQARLNRFVNSANDIRLAFGQGLLEGFTGEISNLQSALTSEEIRNAARELGQSIGEILAKLSELVTWLLGHLDALKALIIGLSIEKVSTDLLGLVGALGRTADGLAKTNGVWAFLNAEIAATPIGPIVVVLGLAAAAFAYLTTKIDDGKPALAVYDTALLAHRDILNEVKATTLDLAAVQAELARQNYEMLKSQRDQLAQQSNDLRRQIEEASRYNAEQDRRFGHRGGRRNVAIDPALQQLDPEIGRYASVEKAQGLLKILNNTLNHTVIVTEEAAKKSGEFQANLDKLRATAKSAAAGVGDLTKEQQRQAKHLQDLIDQQAGSIEDTKRLIDARKQGEAAYRAEEQAIERRQALADAERQSDKLNANQKQVLLQVLGDLIINYQQITNINIELQGAWEWQIQSARMDAEAHARLADAISGTHEAMTEFTAQIWAEDEARRRGRGGDAAYIESLRQEYSVLIRHIAAIDEEIDRIDRLRKHQQEIRDILAQVADVRSRSTSAQHAANLATEYENLLLEKGIRLGSDKARTIWVEVQARGEQKRAAEALLAAEERLAAFQKQVSQAKADNADWLAQQRAAAKYGDEIAGILTSVGMLSAATRELAIQEQIENAIREEKLDRSNFWHQMRILQVEDEIRAHQGVLDALARERLAMELTARALAPIRDAWKQTGETIKDVIADVMVGAEVDWKSLLQSMLQMWARAMVEMVARWIAAWRTMRAVEAAGNVGGGVSGVAGGGGGGGGWLSAAGSLLGGGTAAGGVPWGGVTGNTWATSFVTGPGGGASMSSSAAGAAGAGAVIAAFALIYFGVKTWIDHHKKEMEGFRIAGTDSGGLQWQLASAKIGIARMGGVATQMVKTITDAIRSMGGVLQGWSGDLAVFRSGHGKHTQYWVQFGEGLVRRFGNDAQAAFEFATIQAIKQSNIGGLPKEVRETIARSTAESMEQFNAEVAAAFEQVAVRLGDTGMRVYEIFKRYATSIDEAIRKAFADMAPAHFPRLPNGGVSNVGGLGSGGNGSGKPSTKAGGVYDTTSAEVKAIMELVAARNREIESIRNQLLGINDSASKRLADIASFNRGIEEGRAIVEAQIALVTQMLADLGDQAGEEAARLRSVLKGYLDQLKKIPDAISGDQLNLAIFDTLYQYLQGSQKYAAQAHKYALMKVEIEFQAIKAQLIALGKWEEFADMWTDAYNAARDAAGKGPRGNGRGQQRRDDQASIRDEVAGFGRSGVADQIAGTNKWLDDFKDRVKAAGFTAGEAARLIAAATQEANRQLAEIKKQVMEGVSTFVNTGTAKGGSLMTGLHDISTQSQKLVADLEALRDAGQITGRQFRQLKKDILEATKRQQDAAVTGFANTLMMDLYNLLGMEDESAQLRYELTVLELDLRREELEIAMKTLGYTEERMAAILGPIDHLIAEVRKAGPDLFKGGSSGGRSIYENALGPVDSNPAQTLLNAARRFAEAVDGYVAATEALQMDEGLTTLTPDEQLAQAKQAFYAALEAAKGGDATAAGKLGDLQRQALEIAQRVYAGGQDANGNAGYISLFQELIGAGKGLVFSEAAQNAFRTVSAAEATTAASDRNHRDLVTLQQIMTNIATSLGGRVLIFNGSNAAPGMAGASYGYEGSEAGGAATYVGGASGWQTGSGASGSGGTRELVEEIRGLRRDLQAYEVRKAGTDNRIAAATETTAQNTSGDGYAASRDQSRRYSRGQR
jgi:tape measure domain-containing protein